MVGKFYETDKGEAEFKYVGNLCNGWDIGVNIAKQRLIDKLNKPPFKTDKNRYDIDVAMKSKIRRGKINLSDGTEYDIQNDYKEFLEDLAKELSDAVVNPLVADGLRGNILTIGLVGGGAVVADNALGNKLKDYLSTDLAVSMDNMVIPTNSTTSNADSYLKLCGYTWMDNEE